MARVNNSFKTMITGLLSNGFAILINLISQAIFIRILGSEYLGLNSLFSNILSMLGIVELGIGDAIIFNLYKPIADNDTEKIKSLMNFYKKSYHIVGIIVLIIGILLIPFLPYLINEVLIPVNINIVFLLLLCDVVFSYFLSYKRSILYANQKNYIINIIHIFYLLFLNIFQISILIFTKNYYFYLIIKLIMRLLENFVITIVANKKYNYLNDKHSEKLEKHVKDDVLKKVKALFLHKIGSFVVFGTDNMIISKFLGLTMVGLYSNYNLIISSINTIVGQIISSTTASVGNMLVTENKSKQFEVFNKIRFVNFWITSIFSCGLLTVIDSFIKVWIGNDYLLSKIVLIVLVINFYFNSTRSTYNAFKDAAGIYYEDRFVPIIESILNILISLIFVKMFGLVGVFIGTILSGMVLWTYSYPKFVYKKIFSRPYHDYAKETIGYILLFVILASFTYFVSTLFVFDNIFLQLIINALIAVIIPNAIMVLIFRKSEEFKYFVNIIKNILDKIFKKKVTNE